MSSHEILIVGPLKFQNSLLARYLESETGLKCVCANGLHPACQDPETLTKESLVLWDASGGELETVLDLLEYRLNGTAARVFVAVFNLHPDVRREGEFLRWGLRGVFYENEPPETCARGIKAILNGELWFSRQTISKCYLEREYAPRPAKNETHKLTQREKEILFRIASGAGNKRIADDLCISQHTVKTHVYNIFKKINVDGRLQAALWVANNL